jgi:hypothetical protein
VSLPRTVTLVPRGSRNSMVLLAVAGLSRSCADSDLTVSVVSATVSYTAAGAGSDVGRSVVAQAPPIDATVSPIADETCSIRYIFSILLNYWVLCAQYNRSISAAESLQAPDCLSAHHIKWNK